MGSIEALEWRLATEAALAAWRARGAERDSLVRAAHEAGVSINRISKLSGLSRTTVYRILGLDGNPQTADN